MIEDIQVVAQMACLFIFPRQTSLCKEGCGVLGKFLIGRGTSQLRRELKLEVQRVFDIYSTKNIITTTWKAT